MKKNKLRIFGYIIQQDGVGYYRMAEPLRMIQELGLADVITNPFSAYGKIKDPWTDLTPDANGTPKSAYPLSRVLSDKKNPVDVVLMQRHDSPGMLSVAMAIQKKYGIPVVQENDDYNYDVPETNPGRLSYYEEDFENSYNPDNAMFWSRKSLGVYDAYIVSTPFLKDFYGNYSPAYICPNSIDLSKRRYGHRKSDKRPGEIRIGFSASGGHMEGLWMIKDAIEQILEAYPEVTFYYYRGLFDIFKKSKHRKRVHRLQWAKLEDYPRYLYDMDFDIALAPLKDRLFNRGKSNLRLLEYWSSGKYPVIASPVSHYKQTVKHGVNGLLATETKEWVDSMKQLIESPALRKRLGEEGFKTVVKDFNLEKNASLWVRALQKVVHNHESNRHKTAPDRYIHPAFRENSTPS